ncbi:MAG TPA: FecR domain-containing protein [Ideonella sp.]|nr:FecR domain-containing protein [Ideonella sp.]
MSDPASALVVVAALAAAAPGGEATVAHRIERGDTLIGLLRPGADWRSVQRMNRIANPRRLQPGKVIRIPAQLLREQPTVAEVVHAHGDVSVVRAPSTTPEALAGGATLAAGDAVHTGAQSSVTLRFADGSRLLLRPSSRLRLDRLMRSATGASTGLSLDDGAADSEVLKLTTPGPRRYEIRTPQAILGVRGTEFRTRVDAGATRVEVLEGRVGALKGAREAGVSSGEGVVADGAGVKREALPPAPRLADVPARIERMPLRVGWSTPGEAQRVRAQVLTADEPPKLVLDGVFDAPPARWAEDIPDGRYALRVRAIGASGLEGPDAQAAFLLKARPEPPFIRTPAADARTIDETVLLAWTLNVSAPRVRLQVSDTADFAQPRIDRADLDGTEARVPLMLGTQHWRLASIRADGDQGPFGDAQSVTRVPPPPAPQQQPAQATSEGLVLRWQPAEVPGATWRIQLARDAGFEQLVRDESVSEPQLLLRDPPTGEYFVRVQTIDADGFVGPFGDVQRVKVPWSMWWWLLVPAVLLLI